jgi:hypothetical protein
VSSQVRTAHESGHGKFFRLRLLIADTEQITSYVDSLEQEADQIRAESFRLSWYLRGGATYADVMNMSVKERKAISDLAKENIETTKKSNLPWF